jgi:hypothetical protein
MATWYSDPSTLVEEPASVWTLECPNCGAALRCSRKTEAVTCHCGHVYRVREALARELTARARAIR